MRIDRPRLLQNLEETAELLAADPSAGLVRPRVSTSLVANVHAESVFTQYDREFTFSSDESTGRGGESAAPSPLRYFLSGLAFCQQVWYAKASAVVGVELDELVIHVETFMDMRGEHRMGDVPPNPQWVAIESDIRASATPAEVLAVVDEANARCPLYSLVSLAVPVYEQITLNGTVVRNTRPEETR